MRLAEVAAEQQRILMAKNKAAAANVLFSIQLLLDRSIPVTSNSSK